MAIDRVESSNALVKRSTEELTWSVDLAEWGQLETGETITGVLSATLLDDAGGATISGGPTFSGSVISLVIDGGTHGSAAGKVLLAYSTDLHARREVVGRFLVRDND